MTAPKMRFPRINLRLFNNWLTAAVAVLALYMIVGPFLPQIDWWLKHDSPVKTLVHKPKSLNVNPEPGQKIDGDKLFIPRLEMEETIYGGGIASLKKGVVRLPQTSTPDKGGNTVLIGHRYFYSAKAVFYHLDKVKKGDQITLHWQGKVYNYQVENIKTVEPTEKSVEYNTEEPILTIYTCTPLWTVKYRLVIQAKPVELSI